MSSSLAEELYFLAFIQQNKTRSLNGDNCLWMFTAMRVDRYKLDHLNVVAVSVTTNDYCFSDHFCYITS